MREDERILRNKKCFLPRHFSICRLGTAGESPLFYPRKTAASKPVQSKTGSLAIFGTLGFLRGVGPERSRLRQPGRARLILLHLRIRS